MSGPMPGGVRGVVASLGHHPSAARASKTRRYRCLASGHAVRVSINDVDGEEFPRTVRADCPGCAIGRHTVRRVVYREDVFNSEIGAGEREGWA